MPIIKRREFITGGVVGFAMGALAACEQPQNFIKRRGSKHQLRMVTTWPKNFPGLGQSAERVARSIHLATDGDIDIQVFSAGELVPAFESFDAVSSGAADIYHGAEYYWQGKSPAFNFFTAIPFGMNTAEMNSWIYSGGGQALWDQLSARFNIKALLISNTGTQTGGWFNKPIASKRDLQGLKIRAPGLGGEIYRRLGATPVTLPGSEIFPAMQSGKIDAAEWIGPWNDLTFGFQQLARYCYWPGFHEPTAALALGFNLEVWQSFSDDQKTIIEHCARAENNYSFAEFGWQNAQALHNLKVNYKINFRPFPANLMGDFYQASHEILKELAKKDDITAEIFQKYTKAQETLYPWTKIGEQAMLDLRDG